MTMQRCSSVARFLHRMPQLQHLFYTRFASTVSSSSSSGSATMTALKQSQIIPNHNNKQKHEDEERLSLYGRLEKVKMEMEVEVEVETGLWKQFVKKEVETVFQTWMRQGLPVQRQNVFHALNRLRKLRSYRLALEVVEWVVREKPYKLKDIEYSYLIEFCGKVMGVERAEKLLTSIPVDFQNEAVYNSLVMVCIEKRLIGKALFYMRKMRWLSFPISVKAYNNLILFHKSVGRRRYIPGILLQMKADKAGPSSATYNILLNIQAKDHDIQGLRHVFDEMKQAGVQPTEVTYCILANAFATARLHDEAKVFAEEAEKTRSDKNWATFEMLLLVYGSLLKKERLIETWKLVCCLPNIRSKTYIQAIESFGKVGCVAEAEQIWKELMSRKSTRMTQHFNALFSVYAKHGLIEKASKLFKQMQEANCEPNAITYHHLTLCCLKADLLSEALQTAQMILNVQAAKQICLSIPWLETCLLIVETLADKGNVSYAERFFKYIRKSKYRKYTFVHNILLKGYVNAKLCPRNFIKKMILYGAKPDSETYDLVQLLESMNNNHY